MPKSVLNNKVAALLVLILSVFVSSGPSANAQELPALRSLQSQASEATKDSVVDRIRSLEIGYVQNPY